MRALLFSFLLNNIPLSSLSVPSTLLSFLFIFPALGSPPLPPRTHSIYSPHTLPILLQLLIRSFPLGSAARSPRLLFRIPQAPPGGFGAVGEGGGQHLISYLRINHEVLSAQSRSDPSARRSAGAAASLHPQLPIDKW